MLLNQHWITKRSQVHHILANVLACDSKSPLWIALHDYYGDHIDVGSLLCMFPKDITALQHGSFAVTPAECARIHMLQLYNMWRHECSSPIKRNQWGDVTQQELREFCISGPGLSWISQVMPRTQFTVEDLFTPPAPAFHTPAPASSNTSNGPPVSNVLHLSALPTADPIAAPPAAQITPGPKPTRNANVTTPVFKLSAPAANVVTPDTTTGTDTPSSVCSIAPRPTASPSTPPDSPAIISTSSNSLADATAFFLSLLGTTKSPLAVGDSAATADYPSTSMDPSDVVDLIPRSPGLDPSFAHLQSISSPSTDPTWSFDAKLDLVATATPSTTEIASQQSPTPSQICL